jgi:hypothetical protein
VVAGRWRAAEEWSYTKTNKTRRAGTGNRLD